MVTLTSGGSVCALWLLLLLLLAASHLFVAVSSVSSEADEDEDEDLTFNDFLPVANLAPARMTALGLRATHSGARNERATSGNNNLLAGLRRIQRRPELADLQEQSARKRAAPSREDQKRSRRPEYEFYYVISPVSEQVLPIQSEKLAQGFTGLLPLPGGNYETGLRKSAAEAAIGGATWPSDGNDLLAASGLGTGCRAIKTSVQLTKDELEPASGRVVRRCSGRVQLNACEGLCASSIRPSVKSASGFTKTCSCCNEGSFRRVQVRLEQCHLQAASGPEQESGQVLVGGGHMDVEVEEPIECMCRSCDSLL